MVRDAEATAQNAEASSTNSPGYCLQWSRERAAINAAYPDAATAWRNTNDRHPGNRNPPRGAMAYWTGGSSGYGHIAVSLGGGRVRSTDAGGRGKVATVDLSWPEQAWGLPYAGWAWDVNETTIPHDTGEEDDEVKDEDIQSIAHRVNLVLGDYKDDGTQRDPSDKDPDQGNARLRAIENKVDKILKKLG